MDDRGAITETGGAAAAEFAVAAMIERGGRIVPCSNCAAPLTGPFCAACGQPCETHRRSVLHLLHDFFKDIASFDSRILRTAQALMLRPGELPLAFREGRTQRYVPAVRLYLFVSLLFFLFLSVSGIALAQLTLDVVTKKYVADKAGHVFVIKNGVRAAMEGYAADAKGNVTLTTGGGMRIPMPMIKTDGSATNTVTTKLHFFGRLGADHPHYSADVAKVIKEINPANDTELKKDPKSGMNRFLNAGYRVLVNVESNPDALNGPLTVWIPRLLFLLLPLFALLLAAFYWRMRREFYYVDHLVFSLSTHSFAFVVLVAAAVAAQFVPGEFVAWPTFGVLALYLLLALKRFYGQGWLATGLKFVGIGIIYPTFFLAPSLGAAIVASVVAA